MNRIAIFFLGALFLTLAVLACGDQATIKETNSSCSTEFAFESVTPDMFEIHDTTVTYYQNAVKKIFEVHEAKNRNEFSIDCRGFEIAATIKNHTITFTSSSHEDHSYLLFTGKGVMKSRTVDLYYEVSTPIKERPI